MNTDWIIETALPIATFVCSVFGVFGFFRSVRKPNAHLRFANGKRKISFSPHYYREISYKYYTGPRTNCYDAHNYETLLDIYNDKHKDDNTFCLPFRLQNIGKLQLENYRVEINIMGGKCKLLREDSTIKPYMDKVNINKDQSNIVYSPLNTLSYLNQKDYEDFVVKFIPDPDVNKYELRWSIIAKDCSKSGKLFITLTPTIEEYDYIHFANCERDIPADAEVIKDLKPYILELAEKLNLENK